MVRTNARLCPHNRCSFNGLFLSMQGAELWYYQEKMDRIPDDSLCVFASTSTQISIGVLDVKDGGLAILQVIVLCIPIQSRVPM